MKEGLIRVLLIEDNPGDARLIRETLADAKGPVFHLLWADRLSAGEELANAGEVDVILLDLNLPDSTGFETFSRLHGAVPTIPIVVMSGMDDEALAVKAVHDGAQDYLVKGEASGNLLVRAIRYAIERMQAETERERLINELRDALASIRTLQGLIPICASCKKIRDDEGFWDQIEAYICKHSDATFSHGICPDCMKALYPEYAKEDGDR